MDHLSEFEQDKRIDPDQLDVECIKQAEVFFKWAERAVAAKSDMERLELVLAVTEARLQGEIRKTPGAFGIDEDSLHRGRPTEASVAAIVKQHPRYVEAHDDYLEAKETAALLDKAVAAMEMKRRMLESLITLHGQQYFAGPGTPRNLTAAWRDHQEKIGKSVNQRQVNKARKRGESPTSKKES